MVKEMRQRRIRVGAGRGSAVGSLTCHLLGITGPDPVEHGLLPERFLTADRKTPPDIDIDFQHDRRSEVLEYMRGQYGHASLIISFNRFRPRSIIRRVGAVFGIDEAILDRAAKRVSNHAEETLAELSSEIEEIRDLDPRILEVAPRVHGIVRNIGRHPAGIVVSNSPLTDLVPLCVSKGTELTQFDKFSVEDYGMLKIDALGSRMLTVVARTLEQIQQRHGAELTNYPSDDPATYHTLSTGDVDGVFQLGARYGGELSERMQTTCFDDLVQTLALGRPGVLDGDLLDTYFQARESRNPSYLLPILKPILEETHGIIIFQEQIMKIAMEIAGFSPADSDKLMKIVKDKDMDSMAAMKPQFIGGCIHNGFPEDRAAELWDQIQFFGGYGFNKAHAVGYATHTYETAWLKTHYPLEYFASLLSVAEEDSAKNDKRKRYIADARRYGIDVRPPEINVSTDLYNISADDAICLPLTAVAQVGPATYHAIIQELESGDFSSYEDFCERVPTRAVNSRAKANLVKAGAFDRLHPREELLRQIGIEEPDMLAMERETLGLYLSGHPLDKFSRQNGEIPVGDIAGLDDSRFETICLVTHVKEHIDRNCRLMAFVTIEDRLDQVDVTVFHKHYHRDLQVGRPYRVHGWVDERGPKANGFEILDPMPVAA